MRNLFVVRAVSQHAFLAYSAWLLFPFWVLLLRGLSKRFEIRLSGSAPYSDLTLQVVGDAGRWNLYSEFHLLCFLFSMFFQKFISQRF